MKMRWLCKFLFPLIATKTKGKFELGLITFFNADLYVLKIKEGKKEGLFLGGRKKARNFVNGKKEERRDKWTMKKERTSKKVLIFLVVMFCFFGNWLFHFFHSCFAKSWENKNEKFMFRRWMPCIVMSFCFKKVPDSSSNRWMHILYF